MFWIYFFDTTYSIVIFILLIISAFFGHILDELIDFKKFVKKYYYTDINILKFGITLLIYKIKTHKI